MSTRYLFVPYWDPGMDKYADALEKAKNKQRFRFSMYSVIHRPRGRDVLASSTLLNVVPDGGRLYILIHGTRRGCGSRVVYGRAEPLDVSGRELADHLRNNGLQNRTIDLRLWTCLGASVTRLKDSSGRELQDERGQSVDSSFLLQFSSALQRTHPKICFTGYTLPVSIDEKEIATSGVKKLALTSEAMGTGPLTLGGTSGFKVTVDAVKTNGCRPCYITTATCRGMGLSDDCWELRLLRRFRDEVLLARPEGRAEVREYYAIAPLIVAAIDRLDNADAIYRDILARHLTPAVTAVAAGAHGDAYRLYRRMVAELYTRFVSQCGSENVVKGS